jgi:hypothetical protein
MGGWEDFEIVSKLKYKGTSRNEVHVKIRRISPGNAGYHLVLQSV